MIVSATNHYLSYYLVGIRFFLETPFFPIRPTDFK
jgi:hypothetical protein